ncbi:Rrf2 family transcriptional regulator [Bifidobacterium phasiani]|uniref:Rrf2 family transcriptional regulator n=1 Tax=Bifidobacterium phasiani TaxID=2834431 RepID=A0ABS6WCA3_9BIFI|nr:Rrf2 family transcriptional regulator [Bifidobacterium phasiani]MBW3083372.1 Rrf2 family transcriptional regulator [Bifidobacterium phasiani]
MRASSRFAVGVHTMLCIARFGATGKVTSQTVAASTGQNPVVIRRSFGQLKQGGLIHVERGTGGATFARNPADITLLDVFRATEGEDGEFFGFHENPNPQCPVGRNIHAVLDPEMQAAMRAFERRLEAVTVRDLVDRLDDLVANESNAAPTAAPDAAPSAAPAV